MAARPAKRGLGALCHGCRRREYNYEETLRVAAVAALESLGGLQSAEALLGLTEWGQPTPVRQNAVEALGRLGADDRTIGKLVRPRLEVLLMAPSTQVKLAAVEAVGERRDPASAPALEALEARVRYSRDLELALDQALPKLKPVDRPDGK